MKRKKYDCDIEEGECSEDSNQSSDISSDEDFGTDEIANIDANSVDARMSDVFPNEPELDGNNCILFFLLFGRVSNG